MRIMALYVYYHSIPTLRHWISHYHRIRIAYQMIMICNGRNVRRDACDITAAVTLYRITSERRDFHIRLGCCLRYAMESHDCLMWSMFFTCCAFIIIRCTFIVIRGAFNIICCTFIIICSAFNIICGAFYILCGAFNIICGAFYMGKILKKNIGKKF